MCVCTCVCVYVCVYIYTHRLIIIAGEKDVCREREKMQEEKEEESAPAKQGRCSNYRLLTTDY